MLLNIHQINHVKRSYLSLEGTILVFHEEKGFKGSIQSELQIPLELISVYERFRFKGRYLIISLLSLLAPLLIGGLSYGIVHGMIEVDNRSIYSVIVVITWLILILIGFMLFCIFLIKFIIKRKTVCLVIAPDGMMIEFWKEHKSKVDELLEQIELRKDFLEKTLDKPAGKIVGFSEEHSILPKFFFLFYLSSLPAVITEKISLTCLLLLPIMWFLYRKMEFFKQPKEYRRALKNYFDGEWNKAINLLRSLRVNIPEYLPACLLLIKVYTRANRFDEALETAAELPDEYVGMAQNIQTDIWLFKRIYERRKDNPEEVDQK